MNPYPFHERRHVAWPPVGPARWFVLGIVRATEPHRSELGPNVARAVYSTDRQSLPGAVRSDTNDQAERALADLRAILDDHEAALGPDQAALFS